MMSWIVRSSLKFRFIVVALAATLMFVGVGQLRHSKVDVFPEFAPPKVEVQTTTLGLTASEVEELVTVPLEQALHRHAGSRHDPLEVGAAALVDRDDLRAGHRPPEGPAGGGRAHGHRDADAAHVGGPAVHDPAAVRRPAGS